MRAVEIRLKGDDLMFRLKQVGFRESFGLQGRVLGFGRGLRSSADRSNHPPKNPPSPKNTH